VQWRLWRGMGNHAVISRPVSRSDFPYSHLFSELGLDMPRLAFFLVSFVFVWKSFYGMRIVKAPAQKEQPTPELTGSLR